MFPVALIVFRESLEAALLIGILAVATKGVPDRGRWLLAGLAVGLAGAVLMGSAMEKITTLSSGLGQELVNAAILSVALVLLVWHSVWASVHAKELVSQARTVGGMARNNESSLWPVGILVCLAVLREGAETVLFVSGLLSGADMTTGELVTGTLFGMTLGSGVGLLMYFGLGRINPKNLFSVTQVLILMLAGNLASQLAKTLQQGGWIDKLLDSAWDAENLLPMDHVAANILHSLVGYESNPSQLQVVAYGMTVFSILAAVHWRESRVKS